MSGQISVTFSSSGPDVVGDLHLPRSPRPRAGHPVVVVATPGSSVRGQIGANYATRLAERGWAALTFDPSHQGQSGGYPRDLEDPARRVDDLRCAVDFLTTCEHADAARVALLGVCAGGGYAVQAAKTDHRIRALATVVGINIGRAWRQAHAAAPGGIESLLREVATQRTLEARGGTLRREPWIPDTPDAARQAGITDPDVLAAVDFYRTPRGHDEHSTNRLLFTSNAALLAFDPFHLVEELLAQPVMVVVGSRRASTGSTEDGHELAARAAHAEPLVTIDGGAHYDMYDHPGRLEEATDRLSSFFARHLAPTGS